MTYNEREREFTFANKISVHISTSSRETHSHSHKIYGHSAFQIIQVHTTVINSGRTTQLTTVGLHAVELASALTAAIVVADASVTLPSQKLPEMC